MKWRSCQKLNFTVQNVKEEQAKVIQDLAPLMPMFYVFVFRIWGVGAS